MIRTLFTTAIILLFGMIANAQNVNIPDPVFKNYLLNHPEINTNGDDEIQESEAAAFTGTISYSGDASPPIASLEGIAAFTALTRLEVPHNNLDTLDLSTNTALTYLDCSNNTGNTTVLQDNGTTVEYDDTTLVYTGIMSLNVSGCTALSYLNCSNNSISTLDLSTNTALTYLDCSNNNFTKTYDFGWVYIQKGIEALNINNCSNLDTLRCFGNSLTALNVSANAMLRYLDCSNNAETGIDWSGFSQAGDTFYAPTLSSLVLSGATALAYLDCSGNHLSVLDISANPVLTYVNCADNAKYHYYSWDNDQGNGLSWDESSWGAFYEYTAYLTELNTDGAIALNHLNCSGNAISSLNVSSNSALTYLNCNNNRNELYSWYGYYNGYHGPEGNNTSHYFTPHLTMLNIKNGNNTLLSFFDAKENDYLGCIEVDDAVYAQSVWSGSVDATASFSEDECPAYEDIAVTVETANNVPAAITTDMGTLQMVALVTPEVFTQQVNWSIVPVSGNATITEDGLVTAHEDGTVYAKATSVISPTKKDSMLITISNQISVSVSTENNVPAEITEDQGTLQMSAAVLPIGVNQEVLWSIENVYYFNSYDDSGYLLGDASISEDGLVTALEDGQVYAIAQSILNPSKRDTMLIAISNQIPDGINSPESANQLFSLYPNPNKGIFTLEGTAEPGNYTVLISNVLGQEVYQLTENVQGNKLNVQLKTDQLPAGTYYVIIAKEGKKIGTKAFNMLK